MLPAFPKIEDFRHGINLQMVDQLAVNRAPMLGMIDRHVQFEGNQSTIVRHDDSVGHTQLSAVSGEIRVSILPLTEFTEEILVSHLDDMAEQLARGISEQFFTEIDRATTEVGNVVDADGQPLSEELILKTLAKMELSFDADGNWIPPTIVASPKAVDQLMKGANADGSGSAKFNRALGQLLEEKRNDNRRREADRILAG